jgi:hypothetical protein
MAGSCEYIDSDEEAQERTHGREARVAGLPKESGKRSRKNDRLVTMAILPSLPSMLSLGHNGFLRLQALTLSTNNEY